MRGRECRLLGRFEWARAFRNLSRSTERSPRSRERRGEGGGIAEETADEAGAFGALDIAGAVVDEQRRLGRGAEIGGLLGFSRAKLGETKTLAPTVKPGSA